MDRKKLHSAFIAISFCVMLGAFFSLSLLLPKKGFSESENRYLAQKPAFSWKSLKSGEFGEDYEEYLSDQFPFRNEWIGVKTEAEQAQLKKEINGVFLGKDGYLIEALYPEDLDAELYDKNLDRLCQFALSSRALLGTDHVRLMLVPSASEILKDKLPDFASPFSQETFLTDLQAHFSALSGEQADDLVVPVRETLLDAASSEGHSSEDVPSALYYRTDHHWTTYGAYLSYRAWADSLGFSPRSLEDFSVQTVSETFLGTIYSKLNTPVKPDSIQLYIPKDSPSFQVFYDGGEEPSDTLYSMDALGTRDQYRVFLDGNHGWTKIVNPGLPDGKRLLIVKDSYAHCFAPFAALHFGQVHMLDLRYFNGKISDFLEQQEITDILVLYQIPGFLKDTNVGKLVR